MSGAILDGTQVQLEAPPDALIARLQTLSARGRTHARRHRVGCALAIVGALGAVALGALGEFEGMFLLGVVVFGLYYYATSLDPELAEDPRIAFATALLAKLPTIDGPAHLWLELNAYDMAIADEVVPAAGRTVRSRYVQPWLTLRFERDGITYLLKATLEAEQHQDGIEVLSQVETNTWALEVQDEVHALDGDPKPERVAQWVIGRALPA